MTVYYIEGGDAYHQTRNCDHLKHIDPDRIKSAAEPDPDRHLCYDCKQHHEVVATLLARLSH